MYSLIFEEKAETKNIDVLANELAGLLDADALVQALKSGKYIKNVMESNNYAFGITGVHVVPTYRVDDGVLQDRQEFFNMGPTDTGYGGKK